MTSSSSCWSRLPEDLITKVLLLLPVISLLRFRSVSKAWNSMINSLRFAYDHYHRPSNSTFALVCGAGVVYHRNYDLDFTNVYSVSLFSNETEEKPVDLDRGIFPTTISDVCGPCNGIVCVRFRNRSLALWNPATRRLCPLPYNSPPVEHSDIFSFWVDPLTNSFKIFLVQAVDQDFIFVRYESCNDSWKYFQAAEALLFPEDDVPASQGCRYSVSNGYYYFLKHSEKTLTYIIVAFDIVNELFQEMQMPMIDSSRRKVILDLYDESLAIFSLDKEAHSVDSETHCFEIWVMKERGCWTKLFNGVEFGNFQEPFGFWKKN